MRASYNNALTGEYGVVYVTGASPAGLNASGIVALASCTITGLDAAGASNMQNAPATLTLPAGIPLNFVISSFTVATGGPVVAFKRKANY